MTNKEILLRNRLLKTQHRQHLLNKEASGLSNTTPSRRIKISILLDALATSERKLIQKIEQLTNKLDTYKK